MKAKEAPEKIYIFENPILDFTKLSVRQSDTDIEYTRTDAFIEKAICWIDDNNRSGGCNFEGWEKDFKNYMKGD